MSVIRVKLDEDLSPTVGAPLESRGIDVASVPGQGWSGMQDHILLQKVSLESRILITADRGFSDIRAYPPGSHFGIIVLRPDQESILHYRELLEKLATSVDLAMLIHATTIVSPTSIRSRRPSV